MAKYRQVLQDTLLQAACERREQPERERRFYDALELAVLAAFGAGWLLAILSHL
ncbi:MAG: hypothetical protein IJG70_05835 [Kiritimatiellae bacterium]|nr:hypothetical protein [Kiritimatiellia bacterium]